MTVPPEPGDPPSKGCPVDAEGRRRRTDGTILNG